MANKGVAGVIIDGALRDAESLTAQGLVTFARAATPVGPFKNGPGIIGKPVSAGGIVVAPGDLVVADTDDVSIIPRDRIEWAIEQANIALRRENALRTRIRAERR